MIKFIKKTSIYISLTLLVMISGGFVNHPLKMSATKLSVQKDQLHFYVRMFTDDVSSGMSQRVKKAFPLESENVSQEQKKALGKYLSESLLIKVNSQLTALKCEKMYTDFSNPDMPVIIIEGLVTGNYKASQISKMAIKNTLLFDYAPEQKNVVKLLNINNEDKTLIFNNEQDMEFLSVDF